MISLVDLSSWLSLSSNVIMPSLNKQLRQFIVDAFFPPDRDEKVRLRQLPPAVRYRFYWLDFWSFKKNEDFLVGKNILAQPRQSNSRKQMHPQMCRISQGSFESSYRPHGLSYAHWRDISRRTRTTNPGVNIAVQDTARLHFTFFDFFEITKMFGSLALALSFWCTGPVN